MDFDTVVLLHHHNLKGYSDSTGIGFIPISTHIKR